ncbi:MAG: hypothetical protein Q8Q35_00480 [Nanoarchaeota archaeon]|nr:hypothetical protein [Nanoarchaeota archaeon]
MKLGCLGLIGLLGCSNQDFDGGESLLGQEVLSVGYRPLQDVENSYPSKFNLTLNRGEGKVLYFTAFNSLADCMNKKVLVGDMFDSEGMFLESYEPVLYSMFYAPFEFSVNGHDYLCD